MIENPWEFKWTPFTTTNLRHMKRFTCAFSTRYTLPCATSRRECSSCYMAQQYYSSHAIARLKKEIVHICDRCGQRIFNPDTISYIDVANRKGGTLTNMELCYNCTTEVLLWLNGEDFEMPEVEGENIWD